MSSFMFHVYRVYEFPKKVQIIKIMAFVMIFVCTVYMLFTNIVKNKT